MRNASFGNEVSLGNRISIFAFPIIELNSNFADARMDAILIKNPLIFNALKLSH